MSQTEAGLDRVFHRMLATEKITAREQQPAVSPFSHTASVVVVMYISSVSPVIL